MGRVSKALYRAAGALNDLAGLPLGDVRHTLENLSPVAQATWVRQLGLNAQDRFNGLHRDLEEALKAALRPVDLHPGSYVPTAEMMALLPKVVERTERRRETLYGVQFTLRRKANQLWVALQASVPGRPDSEDAERLQSARFDAMQDVEASLRELEKKIGDVLHGYEDEE